jgi:hypothetical protein
MAVLRELSAMHACMRVCVCIMVREGVLYCKLGSLILWTVWMGTERQLKKAPPPLWATRLYLTEFLEKLGQAFLGYPTTSIHHLRCSQDKDKEASGSMKEPSV